MHHLLVSFLLAEKHLPWTAAAQGHSRHAYVHTCCYTHAHAHTRTHARTHWLFGFLSVETHVCTPVTVLTRTHRCQHNGRRNAGSGLFVLHASQWPY